MIVLKSTAELHLVFNKLIKTLSVPVEWNGNFVVSGNLLILPGKERSVIFNYDSKRVTTNLSDDKLTQKTAEPIEKNSGLINIFNLVLYAFGKWGALKGITVEKDYKKINTLFGAVFGEYGVSADYTLQHCFWYKDGTRITYEDVIQLVIDSELKKAEPEEDTEEETGLWHSTVWKITDESFLFEKLSMALRRKGRIGHNFYKVGYSCPHCGDKLYMASFSGKEKPVIDTVEGRVQLARAFFCPACVMFYTPLPDASLEDEEVYYLDFDGDKTAGNDYMEMLGRLGTREPNGDFNKYADRVNEEDRPKERQPLNGIDKGISDDRRSLNGIDKGISDDRRSLNGIDKGISDERRSLNGIDKGISDDRRSLNGIDKGISDDRRSLNGIDKGISDERRSLNGIDKGISDERRSLNGIDKGISDDRRSLNGIDKGISDERRSLNGIDKGISDDRRNLNGISKFDDVDESTYDIEDENLYEDVSGKPAAQDDLGHSETRGMDTKASYEKPVTKKNFIKRKSVAKLFSKIFRLFRHNTQDKPLSDASGERGNRSYRKNRRTEKEPAVYNEKIDKIVKTDEKTEQAEHEKSGEKNVQAERAKLEELVQSSQNDTRKALVELTEKIKAGHFGTDIEKEYVDKVREDIARLDKRRIDEACEGYLDYNGDELEKLYNMIEEEEFLPEIKKNALDNVSKRLWKIRNEEAELLVKRIKKGLADNGVSENDRMYFYPAREVLEGTEDAQLKEHIESAGASYAPDIGEFEYPIIMADTTKRQNGKRGMFITPDAIYYGNLYTYGRIMAENVERIESFTGFMGKYVVVYLDDGSRVRLTNIVTKEELEGYAKTLSDFVAYLKEKPFSRKEKYLAKESHDVICCFRCGYVYKSMKECPKCGYKFNM